MEFSRESDMRNAIALLDGATLDSRKVARSSASCFQSCVALDQTESSRGETVEASR